MLPKSCDNARSSGDAWTWFFHGHITLYVQKFMDTLAFFTSESSEIEDRKTILHRLAERKRFVVDL